MSINQIRAQDKIPYDGDCSDCGEYQVVALPYTDDLLDNAGKIFIRCPKCEHINYWDKASEGSDAP